MIVISNNVTSSTKIEELRAMSMRGSRRAPLKSKALVLRQDFDADVSGCVATREGEVAARMRLIGQLPSLTRRREAARSSSYFHTSADELTPCQVAECRA